MTSEPQIAERCCHGHDNLTMCSKLLGLPYWQRQRQTQKDKKITIADGGSTALYTAYTVYIVFTVCTIQTALPCLNSSVYA